MKLIDTTVFIDYFRGFDSAGEYFRNNSQLATTTINIMELYIGTQQKKDIQRINKFFRANDIEIIELDEETSVSARKIIAEYFHYHGIGLHDALIAAVAIKHKYELITLNIKHFLNINELIVKKPY